MVRGEAEADRDGKDEAETGKSATDRCAAHHGMREIEAAFTSLVQSQTGALVVGGDPFLSTRRDQLVALASRDTVPAIYLWREFAEAGGLLTRAES